MIRIMVLYPREEGKRFDVDYYVNQHMPMVRERLVPFGMKKAEADEGLERNGKPSPFVVIANLTFETLEDFQRGMATHGAEINGDVANYTDIQPIIQVSRIH